MEIKSKFYSAAQSLYTCTCSVCEIQAKDKLPRPESISKQLQQSAKKQGHLRGFIWLLKQLGKHSKKTKVHIFIPDLVVFRQGKPWFIIKPTKNLSLNIQTNPHQLNLTQILKSFTRTVRIRKRTDLQQNLNTTLSRIGSLASSHLGNYGKQTVLLRYTQKNTNNRKSQNQVGSGVVRALESKPFFNLMQKRPGSKVWDNLLYIQTVTKSQSGFGEIISVKYYSPSLKNEQTDYSKGLKLLENQREIMMENQYSYCDLVCSRIACLLYWYSSVELLFLKGEFMKDDNGKIWLTHVSKLFVKSIKLPEQKKTDYWLSDQALGVLNSELDLHVVEGNPVFQKYQRILRSYYEELKQQTQINRILSQKPTAFQQVQEAQRAREVILSRRNSQRPQSGYVHNRNNARNSSRTWQRVNRFKSESRSMMSHSCYNSLK